jgi:hypothetical protein
MAFFRGECFYVFKKRNYYTWMRDWPSEVNVFMFFGNLLHMDERDCSLPGGKHSQG